MFAKSLVFAAALGFVAEARKLTVQSDFNEIKSLLDVDVKNLTLEQMETLVEETRLAF